MDCMKCGKTDVNTDYMEPEKSEMIAASLCFHCHYWTERIQRTHVKTQVVVKGVVYQIGPESANSGHAFRGHGGRRFKIKFFDGRVIETTNLWVNGDVPPHFRDDIPDNADFEEIEEKKIYHGNGFYGRPTK